MAKKRPLIDDAGEVREMTAQEIRSFRSAEQVLPAELCRVIRSRGQRGKQVEPTKQSVTLRLDSRVVEHFKATGAGWQTRINQLLNAVVLANKPA